MILTDFDVIYVLQRTSDIKIVIETDVGASMI